MESRRENVQLPALTPEHIAALYRDYDRAGARIRNSSFKRYHPVFQLAAFELSQFTDREKRMWRWVENLRIVPDDHRSASNSGFITHSQILSICVEMMMDGTVHMSFLDLSPRESMATNYIMEKLRKGVERRTLTLDGRKLAREDEGELFLWLALAAFFEFAPEIIVVHMTRRIRQMWPDYHVVYVGEGEVIQPSLDRRINLLNAVTGDYVTRKIVVVIERPEGNDLYLFDRDFELSEGDVNWDFGDSVFPSAFRKIELTVRNAMAISGERRIARFYHMMMPENFNDENPVGSWKLPRNRQIEGCGNYRGWVYDVDYFTDEGTSAGIHEFAFFPPFCYFMEPRREEFAIEGDLGYAYDENNYGAHDDTRTDPGEIGGYLGG